MVCVRADPGTPSAGRVTTIVDMYSFGPVAALNPSLRHSCMNGDVFKATLVSCLSDDFLLIAVCLWFHASATSAFIWLHALHNTLFPV